ncbi:NAD(P)/FAD-dependent oxidoreductase [Cyclobacterium xiamenense]|uniref:NAD(P)/FAD-dependent oxidoreductase n=1 Tax=Cyclobacterium xiamenense TaxID=1297121 RepID=UPI0012B79D00|nr:FAD-dependent oxidoreductase [Cyclobacterium xiamenense]
MDVDFLLIGQGLAGSILAYRLHSAGAKVYLVDDANPNSSSKVAAGLYNPITGRKMVKTWLADALFANIEPFYGELERALNQRFLYPTGIYRPFVSYEEQNEWIAKSADTQYDHYIDKVLSNPTFPGVNDSYGGLLLKSSGYVAIKPLLQAFKTWALDREILMQCRFSVDTRSRDHRGYWKFAHICARNLVFCNGVAAGKAPFFDWVPFTPVKGEILTVRQDFCTREIINRGVFRIDMGEGLGKVGSTYNNRELDLNPSLAGKKELLDKLSQLIPAGVQEITDHQVGIRPAIRDRRPVLGQHPSEKNVYLFGGLGAKGVSLAPFFSLQMRDFLISDKEPQKEVNINRFFKYI